MAGMYAVYHGPDGLRGDRPAGARLRRRARGRAAGSRRRRGRARRVLRHRPGRGRRAGPPRSSPPRWTAASTCASSTPTTSASPPTRPRPASTSRPCWAAFGADRPSTVDDARPARGGGPAARRPAARTTTCSPTRSSTQHRSETAMLRYLRRLSDQDLALDRGDDPARLVHDEAQRDHRDGADHLAGVRGAAPVRAGRPGARATPS